MEMTIYHFFIYLKSGKPINAASTAGAVELIKES